MSDCACHHVSDILAVERRIIQEHLAKHKWCNHITDPTDAIIDFVHKFAWLMREVYCGAMCRYKDECRVNEEFRRGFLDDVSDGELQELIKLTYTTVEPELISLTLHVIKHNITVHKWLNRIATYDQAVEDFLRKFGWVIFEVYRKGKET